MKITSRRKIAYTFQYHYEVITAYREVAIKQKKSVQELLEEGLIKGFELIKNNK